MMAGTKDPDAVTHYSIGWSKWLAGDQIQASAWSVRDPGIEAANDSKAAWRAGNVPSQRVTVCWCRAARRGDRTGSRTALPLTAAPQSAKAPCPAVFRGRVIVSSYNGPCRRIRPPAVRHASLCRAQRMAATAGHPCYPVGPAKHD
jgi:hypothetical protein